MIFNDGDGNLVILSGQVGLEALCCDFSFGNSLFDFIAFLFISVGIS